MPSLAFVVEAFIKVVWYLLLEENSSQQVIGVGFCWVLTGFVRHLLKPGIKFLFLDWNFPGFNWFCQVSVKTWHQIPVTWLEFSPGFVRRVPSCVKQSPLRFPRTSDQINSFCCLIHCLLRGVQRGEEGEEFEESVGVKKVTWIKNSHEERQLWFPSPVSI